MSDFKAKMHRIRFSDPAGGANSPLAVFNGAYFEGEGGGEGGERKEREREVPPKYFGLEPALCMSSSVNVYLDQNCLRMCCDAME